MANINRHLIVQNQDNFDADTFANLTDKAILHAIDQVSESISQEHGYVYPETSSQRNTRSRLLGPRMASGEIAVPFYTRGTPTLLYYALGKAVTADAVNQIYTHTITSANTVPSFEMAIAKDLKEHKYVGCAVKSLKIDYSVDETALCTFDLLVRKELDPATIPENRTPAISMDKYNETERSFLGVEVTAKYGAINNFGKIRSFSLEITNDLVDDNHTFGNRDLPTLICQGLTVTGSLTMTFDSINEYKAALDETLTSLKLTYTRGTFSLLNTDSPEVKAEGLKAREIVIDLPSISIDKSELPSDGKKELVLELEFTAQNSGSNGPVVITIKNAENNDNITN